MTSGPSLSRWARSGCLSKSPFPSSVPCLSFAPLLPLLSIRSLDLTAMRHRLTTRMLVGLLIYTSITLTKGIDSFAAAHSPRIFVSSVLASAALEVVAREGKTNTEDPKSLFAFYMHVWNIFYACYAMLPLLQFGKQQIGV